MAETHETLPIFAQHMLASTSSSVTHQILTQAHTIRPYIFDAIPSTCIFSVNMTYIAHLPQGAPRFIAAVMVHIVGAGGFGCIPQVFIQGPPGASGKEAMGLLYATTCELLNAILRRANAYLTARVGVSTVPGTRGMYVDGSVPFEFGAKERILRTE